MSAISAQSTYIPTSIIKNLSDIPANIKWKIMVPHMSVIWHGSGENLCPLLQSTVLAGAGGEKAAGL